MNTSFVLLRLLMTPGLLCLSVSVLPMLEAAEPKTEQAGISFYTTRVIFTATSLSGVTQTLYNKTDTAR